MTASCYLCEKGGHETLPDTSVGDAVGACKLCGVLACLGHGQRDGGQPAYICGICLANLLAVASTKKISTAPPTTPTRPSNGKPPQPSGATKHPNRHRSRDTRYGQLASMARATSSMTMKSSVGHLFATMPITWLGR